MSIESMLPSNHLILCCPLLLLPSIYRSSRAFSNESVLHIRRPKYCSFSFNISPSNEYSGLISFRMDCKSFLQHHSSKASILLHSAFFTVQLSHPYMTTGKTIALTRRTSVGKVMSLLFNMLSMYSLFSHCRAYYLEKAMAPHSSTLAWEIPWMEEPGRLQSMGSLRVRHD